MHDVIVPRILIAVMAVLAGIASAQGIGGTVYAPAAGDLVVIACFADARAGCNEQLSRVQVVTSRGGSVPFGFSDLAPGRYLLFVWRDLNGSGEFEEGVDEGAYYTSSPNQPALVTPPAVGIDLYLGVAPSAAGAAEGAPLSAIIGNWTEGSVLFPGQVYDPVTGAFGQPNGKGASYEFTPDQRYTYALYARNSVGNCTIEVFRYETGQVTLVGSTLTLQQQGGRYRSSGSCGSNSDEPLAAEVRSFTVELAPDPVTGRITLFLTDLDGYQRSFVRE